MRPQPDRIGFVFAFVVDVSLDQFFREDVAFHQKAVVVFQKVSASSSDAGIDGTLRNSSGDRS